PDLPYPWQIEAVIEDASRFQRLKAKGLVGSLEDYVSGNKEKSPDNPLFWVPSETAELREQSWTKTALQGFAETPRLADSLQALGDAGTFFKCLGRHVARFNIEKVRAEIGIEFAAAAKERNQLGIPLEGMPEAAEDTPQAKAVRILLEDPGITVVKLA